MRTPERLAFRSICCGLLLLAAHAQAQVNDNWANRTQIVALPFTVAETQVSQATRELTDLEPVCVPTFSNPISHTLWYGYTTGPTAEYLTLRGTTTSVAASISVYTGTPGAFRLETGGCATHDGGLGNARLAGIRLRPGTSYSIMVGSMFNVSPGQTLDFDVRAASLYQVTTTADVDDQACDATCSLREAISASNATPGAVLIPVGAYTVTLTGQLDDDNATGDFDVRAGMGIYGAGMGATVIDSGGFDRVLDLIPQLSGFLPSTVIVGDLTVTGGRMSGFPIGQGDGGGIRSGNINTVDYLGLERVALEDNQAESGGGAFLASRSMLRESLFAGNAATFAGGGLALLAGQGSLQQVEGCAFLDNVSDDNGGGIHVQADVWIVNSTISGNGANNRGGGINLNSGVLSLGNTTIVRNAVTTPNPFAVNVGGGVRMDGPGSGNHRFVNSVIADNTVPGGDDADARCSIAA